MNQHPAYELFEELGRGENTVVFRAYDLTLGREVAIKELDEAARRDPRRLERFLREAQFLAQFEHDNVLRVHSVDAERGWIVMELMKGTLAAKIAAGPCDPDLVRSVLKQTLDALAFLHEKHKVHGTVRPTNLLINELGRVKLSEFEQTAVSGELRAPRGSKKYLAPELIRPEFGEVGPPLDLYCLGFAALELLKGPAFDSLFPGAGKGAIDADTAWLRWHSSPEELASTRTLIKHLPDDLAQVLDWMLKKRVAERPSSAVEVLKQLADRPLVPVLVAENSPGAAARSEGPLAPAVVRTLAAGQQTVLPSGLSPALPTGGSAKSASGKQKPVVVGAAAAPKFSQAWFNQQLGRPYVLYPLCAAMLLGFWLLSSALRGGGSTAATVNFVVEPKSENLEIAVGEKNLKKTPEGIYRLPLGKYPFTFRQTGFHPLTQEFEVKADEKANQFKVNLKPIITLVEVALAVTPPTARVTVGGKSVSLANGAGSHQHPQGQPLKLSASLPGYAALSRSITPAELTKLGNKVSLTLEREKPKLPSSLTAKPGAEVDPQLLLPVRTLATRISKSTPLEFALVPPGEYAYGVSGKLRESEVPKRTVKLAAPLYIALQETTTAQYQQFFAAAGEAQAGTRWQSAARKWGEQLKLDPLANELPVTNVTSDQAAACCQWLGGRLPTEIEWESAVRGAQDRGYPLPWGAEEPSPARCQIFYGELGPIPATGPAAGASPLGLLNAIGNASEWCASSEDPAGFILRGASFATANINDVRVTWRRTGNPAGEEDAGFRVVIPLTGAPPSKSAATGTKTTAGALKGLLAPLLNKKDSP